MFALLVLCLPLYVYSSCGLPKSTTAFTNWLRHPGHGGNGTQRIIGGNRAPAGAWPWQVLIQYTDSIDGQQYMCGGALLSNSTILTAGHCIATMNMAHTKMFLGTTASLPQTGQAVVVHPIDKVAHPAYAASEEVNPSQEHDIAIIRFKPTVLFSDRISPICLPPPNFNLSDYGYVTGYGAFNRGTKVIERGSEFLQQSLIPIVDSEVCSDHWQNDLLEYGGGFPINDKIQICAGAVGHGSAQGDSGGPFVQQDMDGRWYIIGIVSFGINLGKGYFDQAMAPGIYTRVSSYCEWIYNVTEGEAGCFPQNSSVTNLYLVFLAVVFFRLS